MIRWKILDMVCGFSSGSRSSTVPHLFLICLPKPGNNRNMTTTGARDPLEDETCRRFVLPRLARAGWDETQIKPAYPVNKGRIRATAHLHRQDRPLIADYVLEHSDGLPLAVIEAKRFRKDPATALSKSNATRSFDSAVASRPRARILELDATTGLLTEIGEFPTPEELWHRYRAGRGLADAGSDRLARHRQREATQLGWHATQSALTQVPQPRSPSATEAQRHWLVLATGTGKTLVAAQIVAKLWNSDWPGGRKPRILYLADRRILIDQAKDQYFQRMFGEAVTKLGGGPSR